eukprot:TRINITY_DN5268_c1_g1_i5.p1 TRINITY_DN5268_c1_g1~~TRINITY_DN5268_c1_g1_i5.p1  ORF type:complete len:245 (-),score=-8.77 TRINITY_DN5268_c1_g1_i5:59-793(-)
MYSEQNIFKNKIILTTNFYCVYIEKQQQTREVQCQCDKHSSHRDIQNKYKIIYKSLLIKNNYYKISHQLQLQFLMNCKLPQFVMINSNDLQIIYYFLYTFFKKMDVTGAHQIYKTQELKLQLTNEKQQTPLNIAIQQGSQQNTQKSRVNCQEKNTSFFQNQIAPYSYQVQQHVKLKLVRIFAFIHKVQANNVVQICAQKTTSKIKYRVLTQCWEGGGYCCCGPVRMGGKRTPVALVDIWALLRP